MAARITDTESKTRGARNKTGNNITTNVVVFSHLVDSVRFGTKVAKLVKF